MLTPLSPSCAGTDLDTGIDPEAIMPLIDYWDAARLLYAPFEVRGLRVQLFFVF